MNAVLKTPEAKNKELNILLLGETGVGKSLWINAFAKSLQHPTLKDAIAGKSVGDDGWVIPPKQDKQGQGKISEETTYVFQVDDITIRLIDTSGFNSTDYDGLVKDVSDYKRIMSYLSNFDVIHGICVLLEPSQYSRLHGVFRFCVDELLVHLGKGAHENITFCFIKTQYHSQQGEAHEVLKKLLEEWRKYVDVKIQLENDATLYCVDNRAVKRLQRGISPDETVEDDLVSSWDSAVTMYMKLLSHIANLKPYDLTCSINAARHDVEALLQQTGLPKISSSIQESIRNIEQKAEELQSKSKSDEEIVEQLSKEIGDLEVKLKELKANTLTPVLIRCKQCEYATCETQMKDRREIKEILNYSFWQRIKSIFGIHPTCQHCHHGWNSHDVAVEEDILEKKILDLNAKIKEAKDRLKLNENKIKEFKEEIANRKKKKVPTATLR